MGLAPGAPVTSVYPGQEGKDANLEGVTALDQCITEQIYVRDGITRSLLYNQVQTAQLPLSLHLSSAIRAFLELSYDLT